MIVVTGGAGFIGSALVAALNKRGIDDILVVDRLASDQRWKNLVNLRFADYLDKEEFLEMVAEDVLPFSTEAVFHLAPVHRQPRQTRPFLWRTTSNTLGNWPSGRPKKASGSFTPPVPLPTATEKTGLLTMKKSSKHSSPSIPTATQSSCLTCGRKRNGLLGKVVGLKYFNVFGPNEYHKADMRSFVLKAFEQINTTGKVRLFKSHKPDYKDGEQKRDFLYVKDAVDMTLFFFDNPDTAGIFNLGAGVARSWNDLAKAVFAAMGKKPNIEYIDMPDSVRNQYQYFTEADITKLRDIGYDKQITSLEESVKDYVTNYLQKSSYLDGA